MDGILVGIGTALADDPLLTARPPGPRVACRIIVDSKTRLPVTSQLVRTAKELPTLIVTATKDEKPLSPLRAAGCEILTLPSRDDGKPDLFALFEELGRRRWTNVLVEGGSAIFGSLFDRDLVDEAHVFIGPRVIGAGRDAILGHGREAILQSAGWLTEAIENIDGDAYVRARRATGFIPVVCDGGPTPRG